mmetsp:Transcript_88806/g.129854  ORF Transcript_88806/g.129854 Transcript_88806/m.129854 type:complete len:238 (+) Transcript_88806:202-915(+)
MCLWMGASASPRAFGSPSLHRRLSNLLRSNSSPCRNSSPRHSSRFSHHRRTRCSRRHSSGRRTDRTDSTGGKTGSIPTSHSKLRSRSGRRRLSHNGSRSSLIHNTSPLHPSSPFSKVAPMVEHRRIISGTWLWDTRLQGSITSRARSSIHSNRKRLPSRHGGTQASRAKEARHSKGVVGGKLDSTRGPEEQHSPASSKALMELNQECRGLLACPGLIPERSPAWNSNSLLICRCPRT